MKASLFNYSPRVEVRGFALVATLSLMFLVIILALTMFSLSSISLRNSGMDSDRQKARANARMALMIAIGELQKEMGPDMRISAEAAIHDTHPATEEIDGIAQPHWLAVYDSWGSFLNGEYTPDGKSTADVRTIADTYGAKRAPMFRRWLVSLPENLKNDVDAAATGLSEQESVLMVGEGTLGRSHAAARPDKVTRAYKIQTDNRGVYAWWISPENHKAKIGLAAQQRELSADQWVTAQGVASEVAVGGITGLENLEPSNPDAAAMADRIISFKTLELSGANEESAKSLFFDLTEVSSGVLANTRSGGLKKDLSLLFENSNTTIAPEFTQASRLAPEPSIRPHSKDILAYKADLPRRPFASWPNMRHYYRMYRSTDTDSVVPRLGSNLGADAAVRYLQNDGGMPLASILGPHNMREENNRWFGENAYLRHPILVRYLLIHSYVTDRYEDNWTKTGEISLHYFVSPIITLWNPYSTPLVIEDRSFGIGVSIGGTWPHLMIAYDENGAQIRDNHNRLRDYKPVSGGTPVPLTSNLNPSSLIPGAPIVFAPGEFKVFSFPANTVLDTQEGINPLNEPRYALVPGYVPDGLGSLGRIRDDDRQWEGRVSKNGSIDGFEIEVQLDIAMGIDNTREGNTPSSLSLKGGPGYNDSRDDGLPPHYQIDWFQESEYFQSVSKDESGNRTPLIETSDPLPIGYTVLTLKTTNSIQTAPASWDADWRSRNWLHSPPSYFGSGLYMSEDDRTAHTQRLDSPYRVSFGPSSSSELAKFTGETPDGRPFLGVGSNPYEKITAVPSIELPSAPLSTLASFAGMRMNPGWIWPKDLNPDWEIRLYDGPASGNPRMARMAADNASASDYCGSSKVYMYQSGITGGGIGNSFIHPMIPREEVYHKHNNSISMDIVNWQNFGKGGSAIAQILDTEANDTKAYSDYWDHVLLLNDALWDEYFISSIADQTRPWASESDNLEANIEALTANEGLPISRYQYHDGGLEAAEVQAKLNEEDAYLKAAEHLTVDGAFNVNSTSVKAWYALFKGIRERKLFYRDTTSGSLREVNVPADHIALSRLDTPTTGQETADLSSGVRRDDGHMTWSGVRFLDDDQIQLLAEKCVEQVKRRGPFLNFSEFINRRLENSELGLMGALQSAIDYDDASPQSGSINYRFKSTNHLRIDPRDLGDNEYPTPEAVEGSRLAGIPGYVIQSDLLKPIANTLQVRDDTFRIRSYGEALDNNGKVTARAWCEAIVQRNPEYIDPTNVAHEPAFVYEGAPPDDLHDPKWDGEFIANTNLTPINRQFGRKFEMKSFRWLSADEL